MYKFVWDKDVSNNMVNNEQRLEYKDNYEPVRGNWSSLPQKEEELTPYFIFQGCDAGSNVNCELVSYDQKEQEFKVKVSGQETCHEKCSDNGTSCGRSEGGFCDSCCKWETYSCGTPENPKTCKACAKYKNNSRCMVYKFKNDEIKNVKVKYRYASPLCSEELDPIPPLPEPMDRCGKCSVVETCNSAENYKQTVCENTDCNGPKSVICCPAEPVTDPMSEDGVEFAVGNCAGTNTGSSSDLVNSSECLASRTDQMGVKNFNKNITEIGEGVEYSDASVTMTAYGIDEGMYHSQTKKPTIYILVNGAKVAEKTAVNGQNTLTLKNFKGGKISLGMSAGNYCGKGTGTSWSCGGCAHDETKPGGPGGLASCCCGCPAVCPDGYSLGSVVNPWDGWTVRNVKLKYTKKSGFQSCK